jgi:hypothetical protein
LTKAGRRQQEGSDTTMSTSRRGSILVGNAHAAMNQRTPEVDTTELWKQVAAEYQRTSAEYERKASVA